MSSYQETENTPVQIHLPLSTSRRTVPSTRRNINIEEKSPSGRTLSPTRRGTVTSPSRGLSPVRQRSSIIEEKEALSSSQSNIPITETTKTVERKELPLKGSELTLENISTVVLQIISSFVGPQFTQLSSASSKFNILLATFPIDLSDYIMKISVFNEYFKNKPKAIIVGLNLIFEEDDDLTILKKFLSGIRNLKITSNSSLANMSFLQYCTKLMFLSLSLDGAVVYLDRLSSCENLTTLDIFDAYIGDATFSLDGCENLTKLTLTKIREINGVLKSIKELPKLKYLEISDCDELYVLPFMEECRSLNELGIIECHNLHDIDSLTNCINLTSLIVREAQSGLDLTPLTTCTGLEKITLITRREVYQVEYISDDVFEPLLKLKELTLKGYTLVPDFTFENCFALKELHLDKVSLGDKFPSLPTVNISISNQSSRGLDKLIITDTPLFRVNTSDISGSEVLKEVTIKYTKEKYRVKLAFLENCKKLIKLELENCLLPNYNFLKDHEYLKKLILKDVNAVKTKGARISDYLELDLKFLEEEKYPVLKELYLYSVHIKNLKGIENCSNLKRLTINAGFELDNIQGIEKLPNLKYLDLSRNMRHLHNFVPVENCLYLKELILSDNEISSLSLVKMRKLVKLDISGSYDIDSLEFVTQSSSLRELHCGGADMKVIDITPLRRSNSIQKIVVYWSKVENLEDFLKNSPPKLKSLVIHKQEGFDFSQEVDYFYENGEWFSKSKPETVPELI